MSLEQRKKDLSVKEQDFARRLKQYRLDANISSAFIVSKELPIGRDVAWLAETGRAIPRKSTLALLLMFYGVGKNQVAQMNELRDEIFTEKMELARLEK